MHVYEKSITHMYVKEFFGVASVLSVRINKRDCDKASFSDFSK